MAEATQSRRWEDLLPAWARLSHPVYRREIDGWARSGPLRSLKVGAAPLAFMVFAATGCLCGITLMDPSMQPSERLLMWSIIALVALWAGQWFVGFAIGLIATALTSTVISSEIESETYGLLRVTDIPTREIVLAKYAAALRQLTSSVAIVMAARFLIVLGGMVTIDLALRLEGIDGGLLGLLFAIPAELVSTTSASALALGFLVWLAYFTVARPLLSVLLHAAVGLFSSSITRTRVNAIITAAGMLMVLAVVRFIVTQIVGVFGQVSLGAVVGISSVSPVNVLDALVTTQPSALVAIGGLSVLASVLVTVAWRSLITFALVRWSVSRAYKLPYE